MEKLDNRNRHVLKKEIAALEKCVRDLSWARDTWRQQAETAKARVRELEEANKGIAKSLSESDIHRTEMEIVLRGIWERLGGLLDPSNFGVQACLSRKELEKIGKALGFRKNLKKTIANRDGSG